MRPSHRLLISFWAPQVHDQRRERAASKAAIATDLSKTVSYETLYLREYADKANSGKLWKNLCCQKQKRKRYAGGQVRKGPIPNRHLLRVRPAHVKDRKHVGHWEGDTVIGANHKQVIVMVVERKSVYAVIKKVANKTADLVSAAIVKQHKPFGAKIKVLTFGKAKISADKTKLTRHWAAPVTLQGSLLAGSEAAT